MLVNVSSVQRSVGGCVSNTAIDLKRLDPSIEVRAIGKIGDDEPGRFAVGTLSQSGIDTSGVIAVDGDMITVQFNRTGARKKLMRGFAPLVKIEG